MDTPYTIDCIDLITGQTDTVDTTPDHPFWSATEQQWVDASQLKPGDETIDAAGGRVTVKGARSGSVSPGLAYNLTVAGVHTYHVGELDVLVHNCDTPLAKNRRIGQMGEEQAVQELLDEGVDPQDITRQITILATDPASGEVTRSRIDLHVQGRGFIEVKATETAPLTANQEKAFGIMAQNGYRGVGQRAADANTLGDRGPATVFVRRFNIRNCDCG